MVPAEIPLEYVHFGRWFGSLYRKTQSYMKESFKELGLGFVDSIVLVVGIMHEGITQDEIAQKLAIAKAVVAKSVKVLEAKGFIYRKVNENDMREKHVFGTPEGIEVKKQIDEKVELWNIMLVEDLTEEERRFVFPALRKLSHTATKTSIPEFIKQTKKGKKSKS